MIPDKNIYIPPSISPEAKALLGALGQAKTYASHEGRKSGSERLCLDLVELRLSDRSAVE